MTLKELVARGKVTRDEAKWASKRQTAAEPGSGATFGRLEVSKRQASRILKSPESAARILRAETKKAANKQSRVETSAVFDASK